MAAESQQTIEERLDAFDFDTRKQALETLAADLASGAHEVPDPGGAVNVHTHSFFSFNAAGLSPARIAWEARKTGLDVAGVVDFDVLDAMDEILLAGDLLGLRTVAALETRVFMDAYADQEINSPGEPGVSYFMGTGFFRLPEADSPATDQLTNLRRTADERNRTLLDRLRAHVAPVELDYEADVRSRTPAGNATERHMLEALDDKARAHFGEGADLAAYWAKTLDLSADEVANLLTDRVALLNLIRKKLMKRGGVGYVQPGRETFPAVEDVSAMIRACGAVPCATWLDGTSDGEADPDRLLDDYVRLGCLAINIIPDRNWNIADAAVKEAKLANLAALVKAAKERCLIFSVGTEMNAYGQKAVDTFDAPEMQPFAADFRDGAYILYGHTLLARAINKGRMSAWANETFAQDRASANAFYLAAGRTGAPPRDAGKRLEALDADAAPADVLQALEA